MKSNRPLRDSDPLPEDVIRKPPQERPIKLAGNPRIKTTGKQSPDIVRTATEPLPQRGGRASQIQLHLVPNRHDERFQAIVLKTTEWDVILRASSRGGYMVQERTGMGPDHAVWLRKALENAVKKDAVEKRHRGLVTRVIEFLECDGRFGFSIEERWVRG